jgi:hypothetical protein
MIIFWSIVLIGVLYYAYQWLSKRQEDDAEAFYWTTVREPIVFISETPFDRDVHARHAYAVEMLQLHKNPYLKTEDVWLHVYRIHMNVLSSVPAIEQNHAKWRTMVHAEVELKMSQWLATKYGYNPDAAIKNFANQN